MHRIAATVGVGFLLAGLAGAQDLASYRATFEGSMAEIEATCTQRDQALSAPYLRSLEAAYEQARAAGDLAGTLAAKKAIEHLKGPAGTPDADAAHAGVAALQATYRKTLQQNHLDRARQTVTLAEKYDQALERLQRSHVVAEELDAATAAQKERDRLRTLPAVESARKLVAAEPAKPVTPPAADVMAPPPAAPPTGGISMKDAKDCIAKMDKLSEQDWRKLPGTVVTVEADAAKVCDTATVLAEGDVYLLVPHPRDRWTPWQGRIEECDYRGLQELGPRPRVRVGMGGVTPMALCATVGRGFPTPVDGNFLVTGQGKLELSPGARMVRLEGGQVRGSIRVKIIRVGA